MSDWQHGYADAYCNPKFRGYPERPNNADYMDGFMCGQREYRTSREGKDMGHFKFKAA